MIKTAAVSTFLLKTRHFILQQRITKIAECLKILLEMVALQEIDEFTSFNVKNFAEIS